MIILHNIHDKASREFIENHAQPGDTILDWYDPEQQKKWVEAGGTLQIRAFPAVIVDVPAFSEEVIDAQGKKTRVNHPEKQLAIDTPESRDDVDVKLSAINELLEKDGKQRVNKEAPPAIEAKLRERLIVEEF